MKQVTLTFVGFRSDEVAQKFYSWLIDGGLEDGLIDELSTDEIRVEGIKDWNNDTLQLAVLSNDNTPTE